MTAEKLGEVGEAMAFTFPDDLWEAAGCLPREQAEGLCYAVAAYGCAGVEPDHGEPWYGMFCLVRRRIELSRKAHDGGSKGAAARWGTETPMMPPHDGGTETPTDAKGDAKGREEKERTDKERGTRFAAPTPDEVREYSDGQSLGINAERFVDYYAAQGWRLSNGRPMRDWRAAARNWSRRDRASSKGKGATTAADFAVYDFETGRAAR